MQNFVSWLCWSFYLYNWTLTHCKFYGVRTSVQGQLLISLSCPSVLKMSSQYFGLLELTLFISRVSLCRSHHVNEEDEVQKAPTKKLWRLNLQQSAESPQFRSKNRHSSISAKSALICCHIFTSCTPSEFHASSESSLRASYFSQEGWLSHLWLCDVGSATHWHCSFILTTSEQTHKINHSDLFPHVILGRVPRAS